MASRERASPGDRHAVAVGGSGMLAGLGGRLAGAGWSVTVVGRDPGKLARATEAGPRLYPLGVDYEDVECFVAALDAAVEARGPIRLIVCWIRSWAPHSLLAAAAAVAPGGRLVHVLGSQRSGASAAAIAELEGRSNLGYRQVQLGSVVDGNRRRWLTDDEISAGVFAAIVADRPHYVVGTVER